MARKASGGKADLVARLVEVAPAMAAVAPTMTAAALEAALAAFGAPAPAVAPDGPVCEPVTVRYGDGARFVTVACERYRGRVRVGLRRGWRGPDGTDQTVLSANKVPYLETAVEVRAVAAALLAAADYL